MMYSARGKIHLDGSTLHLDSILLFNDRRDLNRGAGLAEGIVQFDGLAVDILEVRELGKGNIAQVVGFKGGMLTGGGLLVCWR